jgi:hypothetical protein
MNTKDDKPDGLPASEKPVGYASPPAATRFKKGVSGNPKGRPKGSLNVATVFTKTLRERVVINEHGRRKSVTKLEAALKQLVNKAATGDLRAFAQLVELAHDAEAKQNMPGAQGPVLGDLDHEVMAGIMKRFLRLAAENTDGSQEVKGERNGDDECS